MKKTKKTAQKVASKVTPKAKHVEVSVMIDEDVHQRLIEVARLADTDVDTVVAVLLANDFVRKNK